MRKNSAVPQSRSQEISIVGEENLSEIEILKRKVASLESELLEAQFSKPAAAKKAKREFVLTPYQAAKIMNVERRKLGLKEINSPMIYIYARKGAFIISERDGRKEVDEASFIEWMNAHNAKQAKK